MAEQRRVGLRAELSTYKVLARNDRLINRSLRVFTVWIYRGFSEYLPKNDPNDRIYLQYLLESSQQDLPRIYFRIYIYRQDELRIYRGFTGFTVWIYRGFTPVWKIYREDLPKLPHYGNYNAFTGSSPHYGRNYNAIRNCGQPPSGSKFKRRCGTTQVQ